MVLTRTNKAWGHQVNSQVLAKTTSLQQLDGITKMINTLWEKGFMVRVVTFANSEWIVVADETEEKKLQQIFFDDKIPEKQISDAIINNKPIQFLGFCTSHWVLLTEQKPHQEKYTQIAKIFPDGTDMVTECDKIWKEGLVVTHLAFGNGAWILVAGEKPNFFLHWVQEVVLVDKENWNKRLLDNTGTKDPKKIKNLHAFDFGETYALLINWVLDLSKNVPWNVPTISLSHTMPNAKWNELGGRIYKDGQFFVQK